MYSLQFVAHSEVGKVRKNNQDAGYASANMLLVADGMGGAAAGDLASAVASTEAAKSDQRSADGEEMLERIAGIVARSNSKLADLIEEDLELDGMGTTFCGAMFDGHQFALAHIGDSRGYLLRDGELRQLTHDHSWVQSLIDEGKITPAQAAVHPHRSLILRVLNGQVQFDPDLELVEAELGDRLMFCSDGLSGLVGDELIHALLAQEDLETAVLQLAQAANDNGGHDNITIVVGEVVEQDDELDNREPILVGSATEVTVPRTGGLAAGKGTDKDPPYPVPPPPPIDPDHNPAEVARYAPEEPKRRWPGILAAVLAVVLVLAGGSWALLSYAKTRYFIGAEEGNVAVFNGVPGALLGVPLSVLVERTDIPVGDLPRFYQGTVESTISVSSETAASSTANELRAIAARCVEVRKERNQPTPTPTPTPTAPTSPTLTTPTTPASPRPTGSPGSAAPGNTTETPSDPSSSFSLAPPSALGTVTPTALEEADPEAC